MGRCRIIVVGRSRVSLPAVVLAVACGLVACDREGPDEPGTVVDPGVGVPGDMAAPVPVGEPVGGAPANVSDAPLDDDVPSRLLQSRVTTAVVGALDHDSWICAGETSRVEYRLAVDANGSRLGTELDGTGLATDVTFGWAAIGGETLLLDYADVGRQVELGSILFADDDAFRANDGVNGPLECRRQRYVNGEPTRDVSAAAAGDVNRDTEAALALVGRIETRRVGDAAFAHWHCDITDGRATGYVFAGPGVLGPEPRAVAFDVSDDGARADTGDDPDGTRTPVDRATLDEALAFRWLATDGTTLLLVPLEADLASANDELETTSLADIVFPVDDAFTARRADGALLQCLRDGDV